MKRVLVANRGEIALRIIRACHEQGLEAIAVYSEADRLSPHVRAADAAFEIGPPPARDSYLRTDALLSAAERAGADAVHPGYGFLAERADFAEAVAQAGLTFVGPPTPAIRAMGQKPEARRRMADAGVPIVPGTTEPVPDAVGAKRAADRIGYPVLLKAAAGGGGKGMRVATTADEIGSTFRQASSEAESAFGDRAIYVERYLQGPRHVEIQVLADDFEHTVHLGERECSVQRRHQKLIEETPSPGVTADLRARMGKVAIKASSSVGYRSAGTVEFLLDRDGEFYFLEMNTRLQVEHPITEMVYGVDLVREQLRIAAGEPMSCVTRPLEPRGHAIECRITSEDPFSDFLPVGGHIEYLRAPAGPGIRWDSGVETASEITLFYDSLLGKLVVWAESRDQAIERMRRALGELFVVGIRTSQPFHRRVMDDPSFQAGTYDIGYLEAVGRTLLERTAPDADLQRVAIAAALAEHESQAFAGGDTGRPDTQPPESAWLRDARRRALR